MAVGSSSVGANPVGATGSPAVEINVYTPPAVPIRWSLVSDVYTPPAVPIRWQIPDRYTPPAVPIRWDLSDTYTPPAVPIRWQIPDRYTPPALPIRWQVAGAADLSPGFWSVAVTVGGLAIGERLVAPVTIDAEEDAAGVAECWYQPPAGSVDPEGYIGAAFVVDFVRNDAAGAVLSTWRKFTGRVTDVDYDPDQKRLRLRASNDLQDMLEAMDRDTIAGLVGGYWSPHVFDDTADGYQYALDRLSTRAASLWVDAGGFPRVTDWAAKVVPDLTFTDAERFDETLRLARGSRRDILNKITLSCDFRFSRLRHREIGVNFSYSGGWCEFLRAPFTLCERSMVEQAASAGGWVKVGSISYVEIPQSGVYNCFHTGSTNPLTPHVWIAGQDNSGLCLGASWKAARRWAQTVTETHVIEVAAPDSIEAVGEIAIGEDYGLESEYDASGWEGSLEEPDGPPTGAVLNSAGDYVSDATAAEYDGRAAFEVLAETVIAKARADILRRHRTHGVAFSPSYRPDLGLEQTLRIETPGLVCQGKIRRIRERLDPLLGRPSVEVEVALSRHGGNGSASDDPITAPAALPMPEEAAPDKNKSLGYHIGGTYGAPADDPAFEGYVANYEYDADNPNPFASDPALGGTVLYQRRFAVTWPEIEASAREAVVEIGAEAISVAIPQDELSLNA